MTIAQLRAAVRAAFERLERANSAIDALTADSTDEQRTAAQTEFDAAETEHRNAGAALTRAQDLETARRALPPPAADTDDDDRRNGGAAGGGDARVTREPLTYERGNGQSYFLDLARVHTGRGDGGAQERLNNHGQDTRSLVEARERRASEGVDREMERLLRELPLPVARALERSGVLGVQRESRALTRVDGAGGQFVPPLHLLEEYAPLPRASRPMVESMRQIPLPAGTDSINIPKISTGTATAIQATDGAAVQSTDLTDALVTAPVRTIAGQQDVALQLLDQSPIAFDEVVFGDLIADYYFRCEDQGWNGSGAAGTIKGMLAVAFNAITYTDASPTVPELYPKIADALNQARTNRKRPITHGWLHPRRAYWTMAALDSQTRPLVVPQVNSPMNAVGVQGSEVGGGSGEDHPINLLGVNHWMSDAMPTNLGAGTNEDRIVETRMADHLFFESDLRARAMSEVLSGTLQVRLQVYSYVAATFERYPNGISVVAGTGLVTPTF
jgi:HK97 family phage major capsid protein